MIKGSISCVVTLSHCEHEPCKQACQQESHEMMTFYGRLAGLCSISLPLAFPVPNALISYIGRVLGKTVLTTRRRSNVL